MHRFPAVETIPPDETGIGYIVIPFRAGTPVHVDDVILPIAEHIGPLDGAGAVSARLLSNDPESVARRIRRMRQRGDFIHVLDSGHLSASTGGQMSAIGVSDCKNTPLPPAECFGGSALPSDFAQDDRAHATHGGTTETGVTLDGRGHVIPFPTTPRRGEPIPGHLRTPTVRAMEAVGERFGVPLDMDRLRQVRQAFARITGRDLPDDPSGLDMISAEVATRAVSPDELTYAGAWPWAYFGGVLADACGKMRRPAWAKNVPVKNGQGESTPAKAADPAPIKNIAVRAPETVYGPDGYEQQPPTPDGVHDEAWAAAWAAVVRCQTVRPGDRRGKARDVALQWQNRLPAALDEVGRLRGAVMRWCDGAAADPARHKAIPSVDALAALLPKPKPTPRGGVTLPPHRVVDPGAEATRRAENQRKIREIQESLARISATGGMLGPPPLPVPCPPQIPMGAALRRLELLERDMDRWPKEQRRKALAVVLDARISRDVARIEAACGELEAMLGAVPNAVAA